MIGLSAAAMLARDGHQVTVLEADRESPPTTPAAAWEHWQRKGVAQFRQPHNLFPRFRQVCEEELPDLTGRLAEAGCTWVDPLGSPARGRMLPTSLSDRGPRDRDEAFRHVTGRCPVVESVIAAIAAEQPGMIIRCGVRATELTGGPPSIPDVPHVAGVRTSTGKELHADLVVDAMGDDPAAPNCWRRWARGRRARKPKPAAPAFAAPIGGYLRFGHGPAPAAERGGAAAMRTPRPAAAVALHPQR